MKGNPFNINGAALRNIDDFYGREGIITQLDHFISDQSSGCVQILGVMGVGKTSLLNAYFSFERKRAMAREYNILVCSVLLDNKITCEDLSSNLFKKLKDSVREIIDTSDEKQAIISDIGFVDEVYGANKTGFEELVLKLYEKYQYRIALIFDGFEHFTTSLSITQDHHNMLRTLVEKGALRCLVASNCDLEKTSLPKGIGDSYYIENFSAPITMEPYTLNAATNFINRKLENNVIQFTPPQIEYIYNLSGGIPRIFEVAAHYAYENIFRNNGSLQLKGFAESVYNQIKSSVFEKWCKYFNEDHLHAIEVFIEELSKEPDAYKKIIWVSRNLLTQKKVIDAVNKLTNRGLFLYDYHKERYMLNSILLQCFVLHDFKIIEKCVECNPLNHQEKQVESEMPEHTPPAQPYIIVHGDLINNGTVVDQSVTTYNITNNEVSDCVKTLIDAINENNKGKEEALLQVINQRLEKIKVQAEPSVGEDEVEQAISNIVSEYKEGDGDDTDFNTRFNESLKILGLEDLVTEARLNNLSKPCQFYLKSAIIVDALADKGCKLFEDFAIKVLYYGKCIEQNMREKFFKLFKECEPYNRFNSREPLRWFASKEVNTGDFGKESYQGKTTLGNYSKFINLLNSQLAEDSYNRKIELNEAKNQPSSVDEWKDWWKHFQEDLHDITKTRNLGAHANYKKATDEDIKRIKDKLLNPEGLLWSSKVGKDLFLSIISSTTIGDEEDKKEEKVEEDVKPESITKDPIVGKVVLMYNIKKEKKNVEGLFKYNDVEYKCRVSKQYVSKITDTGDRTVLVQAFNDEHQWYNVSPSNQQISD